MLSPRHLVGFTGHRSNFDAGLVRSALKQVLGDVMARTAAQGGRAELCASVAEGTDTICVEVARELGMPVHLLLPLEEAEFAKDFSSPEVWQRAQAQFAIARQRSGCDSVHLIPGETTRPECYCNQSAYLLEVADLLVAVWDGKPARGPGGTAEIIGQAEIMGLPVVKIDAASGAVSGTEGLAECFKPDAIITELNKAGSHSGGACEKIITPDDLQKRLDEIAVAEAARFRPSLVRIILLHGIAALLATIVTFKMPMEHHAWNEQRWIITAVELGLVVSALWMAWRLHHRHSQERWIRCRFACELVRGLRHSVPLADPLRPAVARHDPAWRRFALSTGLLVQQHHTSSGLLAERDRYVATRLSDTHPEGQIRHYREMRPAALRWWDLTAKIGNCSAWLAPVFVLLSLLNKLSHHWTLTPAWHLDEKPLTWPLVVFLPIALPLAAGVAAGLRQAMDAGRRKERYPQMVQHLTDLKKRMAGLQTTSTIRNAVGECEEILLDELSEWQLAMRNTGH
jgi:hypothetical protein